MADSKYKRFIQMFPKTFSPIDGDEIISGLAPEETVGKTIDELWNANVINPVINALLRGFAQGDDNVTAALEETKAQLFVKTSSNQFLDVIASSLGVSRPGSLGLSDEAFRNLVPALSLRSKQVRQAFYNAMDAFYGPEFSRSNLDTTGSADFDLRATDVTPNANPTIQDTLQFSIDSKDFQSVVIRERDFATAGAVDALELNSILNNNLVGITAEVIEDPITKEESIRLRTNTPGLRGSVEYRGTRKSTTTFSTPLDLVSKDDSIRTISVELENGFVEGDVITLNTGLMFTILNVTDEFSDMDDYVQTNLLLNEDTMAIDITINNIVTRIRTEDIDLFPTDKAELLNQVQRTVVYEVRPNEVVIELPAVIPTLQRGLRGALHVHNGPLLNTIIDRGESTEYLLPSSLFGGNDDNLYTVTSDESWVTYDEDTRIITLTPPAAQGVDVYSITVTDAVNTDKSFVFFVRVDDRLNPAEIRDIWQGAFIFDPNGSQTPFTVTGQSAEILGDNISGTRQLAAGQVYPRVDVDPDTNTLPEESGLAVIGFGSSTQEPSLVRYRGKASESIIELDPSFVFTKNQVSGTSINIVSNASPFVPDRTGGAYPIYLTSSTEARVVVENILTGLAAAGVIVNFVVLAPSYKYLIDNPYLTDDDAPLA